MNTPLWSLTAAALRELVRRRELSRRELVQAHLDRVRHTNERVRAIVELRGEAALAEADAADRAHASREALPLDGIPITLKDHFDLAGMHHTEGVPANAQVCSPSDETVVRRLRDAGAIVIGKCNQPDYQIRWNTISHLHGATRNPRDLGRSAGGSSGGDAAAVAAGMAPIGLGLDYGGSIRVPASFCGIYGLRPSAGMVPASPTLPPFDPPPTVDLMASIGPLARSVDDLWTVCRVLAGADPGDPASVPVPLGELRAAGTKPRVVRMLHQTGAKATPEIVARLDRTARILAAAGYEVVDGGIPHATRAPEVWAQLVGTELLRTGMPMFGDQLGASNRQHIEMMFGLFDLGPDVTRYIGALLERRAIVRETAHWMARHPLVLAPVAGMATPRLDFDHLLDEAQTVDLFDHMRNIMWVNLLGLPSVALPNGIQIVARRFHDAEAMQAAALVERELGHATVAAL
jgi:amidase